MKPIVIEPRGGGGGMNFTMGDNFVTFTNMSTAMLMEMGPQTTEDLRQAFRTLFALEAGWR
jgi:hypothetical protein